MQPWRTRTTNYCSWKTCCPRPLPGPDALYARSVLLEELGNFWHLRDRLQSIYDEFDERMRNPTCEKKWYFLAPLAILAVLLFIVIGGELVLQLWNWLLPPIFGWRQITFWQALGMLALCRILFGGFGGHGFSRSRRMTPEERERFRQRLRERWGFGASTGESQGQ